MKNLHYWQEKLSLWLHDPVHKAFDIRRHEFLAREITDLLHIPSPAKDTYQNADMMASGLTRAAMPGYDTNEEQSGAIVFSASPYVTHPLVAGLKLRLPITGKTSAAEIHESLKVLLTKDLGLNKTHEELSTLPAEEKPLSGYFNWKDTPEEWAQALYFYLFFALQKRLRLENVGGLGGAWDLLPADSRMPDHSLWHHLGLTSAIGSALSSDPEHEISLTVFSLTPVQAFIGRARKLRDHWLGSVLLSYLAFTGIRHIAETLGPDHIVYPSLHDQSLVETWIGKQFHLERFLVEHDNDLKEHRKNGASIASFPNKFVFLSATSHAEELCRSCENAMQLEWLRVARIVKDYLATRMQTGPTMNDLFEHQISDYWQFGHASCRLVSLNDKDALRQVLAESKWQAEENTVAAFAKMYGQSGMAVARLYGATHSLVQSLLAATKYKPTRIRKPQNGEKCPLCGEHEVLHDFSQTGKFSAGDYKDAIRTFWQAVHGRENSAGSSAQVGKNERICSVCAVKRFLPRALKQGLHENELLASIVADADRFPATTELAAKRYLDKLDSKVPGHPSKNSRLIDALHESELDGLDDGVSSAVRTIIAAGKANEVEYTNRDKYYALLLMDGDKMGHLVNGKTLTSTWGDVLHPELTEKFSKKSFHPDSPLRARLEEKRILNPAVHAAISEGLNSFARYGVAPIVERLSGRLIYAGGDDVCAVLPLDAALQAARAIQTAYCLGFVRYGKEGATEVTGESQATTGKLGMHLGKAKGISISGAIVIAHHKAPLREVLRDAHTVLTGIAKNRAGRNALAIRLKKRSGGDRDLWLNWNEPNPFCLLPESLLTSFELLMQGVTDEVMGGRLLYSLANLEGAIAPLATTAEDILINREKIIRLIEYEVGHSGKGRSEERLILKRQFAERLAGLMIRRTSREQDWFNPESAIVARFLAIPQHQGGRHEYLV
ncbi:MAG: type III-B CRISPR-associated protein Cas10/Cmr2 [Desulfocapsaceae bacterium]|nr:type III-B CRISPR-associated protein Cas10/Cmr2 [Desulfocapsaceae bacterium]